MAERGESRPRSGVKKLRYIAAVLAIAVAAVHLLHPRLGAPRLVMFLEFGTLLDPRPLAFTLAGFFIVFGIVLVYQGLFVRAVYLGGIALMLVFVFGYVAWHTVLNHGGFWPHIHAHGHDGGVVETVWIHLVSDTYAMVSKLLEAALLAVLVALYRLDSL